MEKVKGDIVKNMQQAVEGAALAIQKTAKTNISRGTRSGYVYKRRGITHVASKAGEYPKTDTGRLVNSIRTNFGRLYAQVGSDVEYSTYLENGYRHKTKSGGVWVDSRPWLYPSLKANEQYIQKLTNDAIKDALR